MPSVNINLRINDISTIVEQLDIREKIKLIKKLEEEIWSMRFDQLLGRIRRRVFSAVGIVLPVNSPGLTLRPFSPLFRQRLT